MAAVSVSVAVSGLCGDCERRRKTKKIVTSSVTACCWVSNHLTARFVAPSLKSPPSLFGDVARVVMDLGLLMVSRTVGTAVVTGEQSCPGRQSSILTCSAADPSKWIGVSITGLETHPSLHRYSGIRIEMKER